MNDDTSKSSASSFQALAFAAQMLVAIAISGPAHAQDDRLYTGSESLNEPFPYTAGKGLGSLASYNFDCSVETRSSNAPKPGGKTQRRMIRDAAESALAEGYNYALVRAPRSADQQDYRDVVKYGWGQAKKQTQSSAVYQINQFPCMAIDDVKAAAILFDTTARLGLADNETLVDLRALQAVARKEPIAFSKTPPPTKVDPRQFSQPGSRERLSPMIPIMSRAIRCRSDLVPVSVTDLSTPKASRDLGAETACLAALRADAEAAGWSATFATPRTGGGRGYSLGGGAKTATPAPGVSGGRANAQEWGTGWTDVSDRFPTFDGIVMTRPKGSKDMAVLVASDTADDVAMIDVAIYLQAQRQLSASKNGVRVVDFYSEQYESFFANTRRRLEEEGIPIGPNTVSQSVTQKGWEERKGFFRARELHAKARVFHFSSTRRCSTDTNTIACGDKLSVINTLGPLLQDTEYQLISTPTNYRPAD